MRERDGRELRLRLAHVMRSRIGRLRAQRSTRLRRRLERRDVRRVTADLRTRLVRPTAGCASSSAGGASPPAARAGELAARLDALSPLAVLGRGYAVCWNESRTSIIRSAAAVRPGDGVRVTLADGELACQVVSAGA